MNPADKRLGELLDKWLASLELHLKYSSLSEDHYRKVQPWPEHDRPSRWIVELALQKARQLKEQHEARIAMGDAKFADALDLMAFLNNLMGSQHVRRFIPLAEPGTEVDLTATQEAPKLRAGQGERTQIVAGITQPRKALQASADATREMPRLKGSKTAARREGKTAASSGGRPRTEARPDSVERERTVVADAVRLLDWGRKWHELPELISRMADRPSLTEVRRILREHKSQLDRA